MPPADFRMITLIFADWLDGQFSAAADASFSLRYQAIFD
jgi:hypothetical protein